MQVEALPNRFPAVRKALPKVLQVNVGRLCNQACRHCHVDSGPGRTAPADNASQALLERVLELLRREPGLETLDVTGGAPELNPSFRALVDGARALGRRVLVRHNLTVQDAPGQADLPAWFAERGVELFCSLPCYLQDNVDRQRGAGVYDASVRALQRLNEVGYGAPGGALSLTLVYNPGGPSLPPPQAALEQDYRRELGERFGLRFTRLVTITNQPIHRFRADLERAGALDGYHALLRERFNPATLEGLMCLETLSVRWDGRLYDCDFDLVEDLPLRDAAGVPLTLDDLLERGVASLAGLAIAVGPHCFACTAGCGSSCGGALVP